MKTGLQVSTPSDKEILMTRVFDAPRRLVWDAHTRCDLLKKWLFGPDGWELAVCEVDLTVGGRYRYVWRHPKKKEMALGGVMREIVTPERLVQTEQFEDPWYPGEALDTMVLTEQGGKTLYTLTMLFQSKEGRDIALKSGMETGMEMGFARLDKIFAAMGAGGAGDARWVASI
jgi:uncharacterized protein YndB with AHSA1/START domain